MTFLNSSAKEALIEISNWYDEVNCQGYVAIDDLSRLKAIVDEARRVLEVDKDFSSSQQQAFDFGERDYYSEIYG